MPSIQNLVLTDRSTPTPVAHTFTPSNVSGGVGTVVESNGQKIADSEFTISMKESATGRFNGKTKLAIPMVVMETVNGVTLPKIVDYNYVEVRASFSKWSTTQDRANIIGMTQNSLDTGKTLVHKTFIDLEGVYGN